MASEYFVDPVETVRKVVTLRIKNAGIFTEEQIQRENQKAPDNVVPYCRITVPQGAEFTFDSQNRQSKIIIVEFDILTRALEGTQLSGQLASRIEGEFGMFDRYSDKGNIEMPNWTGASASVHKFGRGTASTEADKNLYYLPVLLYVKIELESGAKYEL